jgi:hypothetical protein
MTIFFGLMLIIGPVVVLVTVWLVDASDLVRRLGSRGEVNDVANEETRALIDGEGRRSDPPLPAAEATRVNAAFRGLTETAGINDLEHLDRFFVNGDGDGR